MKKRYLFFCICLVCLCSIISCVQFEYVNKDPSFSFKYPYGFKSVVPWDKNQVARFEWKYRKAPFFMAYVLDKPKDATLDGFPNHFIKLMMENAQVSISILDQKKITLSDGTEAMAASFKWRLNDMVMPDLQTASVTAFKGDKIISVSGTSSVYTGYNKDLYMSLEEMMQYCMTLKFNS